MDNFGKGKNVFERINDGLSSLKLQYHNNVVNKNIRIELPYLNHINDNFVVYLIDLSNGQYQLTDDGWTIDEFNHQHQSVIQNIINQNNVSEQDGEVFTTFKWNQAKDFAEAMRKMIQTMIGLDALLSR